MVDRHPQAMSFTPFARLRADLRRRYPRPLMPPSRADDTPAEAPHEGRTDGRLERLPPEIGVLLIVIGTAGLLLPGPVGSPFLLAGGLALWPAGFSKIDDWFRRRFPNMHREGMSQIDRFITDLERRYPGSAG